MGIITNIFDGISTIGPDVEAIDPAGMFDSDGVLRPHSFKFWEKQTRAAKMLFGHQHALYSFPTVEVIDVIAGFINDRRALEIGAGNGGYCRALHIKGTDSYQQAKPEYAAMYRMAGQPTVNYGYHVERLDAECAIHRYRPEVVLGAWVTHKFDPMRPELRGNVVGVDEHALLDAVDEYIFIGNTKTHKDKPLLHDLESGRITSHFVKEFYVGVPWLQSRASGGLDFILRICRK